MFFLIEFKLIMKTVLILTRIINTIFNAIFMITANELKTKGIKALEKQLSQTTEVAITV